MTSLSSLHIRQNKYTNASKRLFNMAEVYFDNIRLLKSFTSVSNRPTDASSNNIRWRAKTPSPDLRHIKQPPLVSASLEHSSINVTSSRVSSLKEKPTAHPAHILRPHRIRDRGSRGNVTMTLTPYHTPSHNPIGSKSAQPPPRNKLNLHHHFD